MDEMTKKAVKVKLYCWLDVTEPASDEKRSTLDVAKKLSNEVAHKLKAPNASVAVIINDITVLDYAEEDRK